MGFLTLSHLAATFAVHGGKDILIHMIRFLILFCVAGVVFPDELSADSTATAMYAYRRSIGCEVDTVYRTLSYSADGVAVGYCEPPNINTLAFCDTCLRIHSWQYKDTANGCDITVLRRGDTLSIQGLKKNKSLKKLQIIDSLPWHQAMEFSLLAFLRQGAAEYKFWIVRPSDMTAFKMIARRKSIETVQVNGRTEQGIKITLSPRGVVGRLWHVTLWYKTADFSFLKSSMPGALPGASPTIVETVVPVLSH